VGKRILFLTQWFDPEPGFKGLVFARELVRRGFDVEVLTGFPNYPGGRLYPGYKIKRLQREELEGVKVTRVPLYPSHDQSALRRVANYFSFAAAALWYGVFLARRPHVIYAYHPPLTVGIVAIIIKALRRAPLIYDVQDMWPDTLRATGMITRPRVLAAIGRVCRLVYRRADCLVVLSPGFKRLLIQRGVPERKIDVIYNWCNETALDAHAMSPRGNAESEFRVLFAGNIGKAQALDAVLKAASILRATLPRAVFVLVGGGVDAERLKSAADREGLDNVRFVAQVPMDQVGAILSSADVLLVHLRRDPLFEITIPSKTQAYMAMGKPILMAVQGDAAELVRHSQCGMEAISEDAESIAAAVHYMASLPSEELKTMGRRAREYYLSNLSIAVGVQRFSQIFDDLIEERRWAR
jgi:glycosyltransferase involved in cell wall biosynthesis